MKTTELVLVAFLVGGCAEAEPLAPLQDAGNACDACWDACGEAGSYVDALTCSEDCSARCGD
jgi:hypothetical protein